MGSHMNFKNIIPDGNDGRPTPMGNFPLARQSSVYSLTFDEFQNSLGGVGKDFGSMNMDEFLKNIWTAEETQAMATATIGTLEGGTSGGNLQKQGSLTLPRTLSQKTVDEVWRDIFKDSGGKEGSGNLGPNLQQQQRQQTLGEMTLEEFLVRAGVVREEAQPATKPNNGGFYGELLHLNNNMGLGLGFPDRFDAVAANQITESNSQIPNRPNLEINVNGTRSSQQQQQQQQQKQQQQQLFPKQATMAYAPQMQLPSNAEAGKPGMRNGIIGIGDSAATNGFIQGGGGGGGMGMVGLGAGAAVSVAMESPGQLSSDGPGKSNGNTSSLSSISYSFNGLRGRKYNGTVEKVIERRQKRMIKNRESAARSRARKQAYTMELETEVARLKDENKELKRKQAEIMEMQKIQVIEMINQQPVLKKRCLRRTQTGPW